MQSTYWEHLRVFLKYWQSPTWEVWFIRPFIGSFLPSSVCLINLLHTHLDYLKIESKALLACLFEILTIIHLGSLVYSSFFLSLSFLILCLINLLHTHLVLFNCCLKIFAHLLWSYHSYFQFVPFSQIYLFLLSLLIQLCKIRENILCHFSILSPSLDLFVDNPPIAR